MLATLLANPSPAATHQHQPTITPARTVATWPAEGPGPAMLTARYARLNALTCYGLLEDAPRSPILLIAGTAIRASENWEPTYLPVLLDRGHGVCTIDLPNYGTQNVQANSEYVATAIRTIATRSTRKLSIIGHSQGAFLPHIALRTWPDLSPMVEDLIGLAGVYDRGSAELTRRCQTKCTPVLHQLATGSNFLTSIRKRPLPQGPSYTNIGALGDLTVTPQPAANQQPGATSIMVQDVCPGRVLPISEHAMIAGDTAALAVTLDALDHPGTANLERLDPAVCDTGQYPEFNSIQFLAVAALTDARADERTTQEPALYCRHQPACSNPRLRGPLVTPPRYNIKPRAVTIRTQALGRGTVVVRLGRHRVRQHVQPGPMKIMIRRPNARKQLKLLTRPEYFTSRGTEATRWIPGRRSR